ncbi:unnamed protein product, partial [Prorocentrum cordatum]
PGLALGWDDAAGAWAPVAPIRHYWASEAGWDLQILPERRSWRSEGKDLREG